jgi:hypothetical protein
MATSSISRSASLLAPTPRMGAQHSLCTPATLALQQDDAPSTDPISATGAAVDKTVLKACRLFEAVMHCSTVDLREAPPPAPPHSPGAMTTSSFDFEKVVGSPKCNVSGTTEGEATGGDYNVTVDGRSCTCSKVPAQARRPTSPYSVRSTPRRGARPPPDPFGRRANCSA